MTDGRNQGFTLLEVLAALTLLALTFFVVMGTMGQAIQALYKDQRATRLALAAHSVLEASVGTPLRAGQQRGRLADGVVWQLRVSQVAEHSRARLYRLDLTLDLAGHVEQFSTLRVQGMTEPLP